MERIQSALLEIYLDLKDDCQSYDEGNIRKAKDIAGRIRTLVKDGPSKKTVSILQQLNKKNIQFIDSAIPYTQNPGFSFFEIDSISNSTIFIGSVFMGLVFKKVISNSFNFNPLYTSTFMKQPLKEVSFENWWNQIIYEDRGNKFKLSRKELILSISEQDGFAHFDPKLNPEYEKFLQADSLEMIINFEKVKFNNSAVKGSIRQIGYEIILTLERSLI